MTDTDRLAALLREVERLRDAALRSWPPTDRDLAYAEGCAAALHAIRITTDILAIEAEAAAAEREKYRALVFALTNEGPKPEHHRRVMARHRQEWPALWRAIDAIALAALEDSDD